MGEVVGFLLWRLGESLRHPFIKPSVPPNQQEKENKTEPTHLPQKNPKHAHTQEKKNKENNQTKTQEQLRQ